MAHYLEKANDRHSSYMNPEFSLSNIDNYLSNTSQSIKLPGFILNKRNNEGYGCNTSSMRSVTSTPFKARVIPLSASFEHIIPEGDSNAKSRLSLGS